MTKLVNKHVVRECVVGGYSAVEIEDSATTVRAIINQHFDKLVRRKLCGTPQRTIVKR
jgi:D-aminopeptidase